MSLGAPPSSHLHHLYTPLNKPVDTGIRDTSAFISFSTIQKLLSHHKLYISKSQHSDRLVVESPLKTIRDANYTFKVQRRIRLPLRQHYNSRPVETPAQSPAGGPRRDHKRPDVVVVGAEGYVGATTAWGHYGPTRGKCFQRSLKWEESGMAASVNRFVCVS